MVEQREGLLGLVGEDRRGPQAMKYSGCPFQSSHSYGIFSWMSRPITNVDNYMDFHIMLKISSKDRKILRDVLNLG